MLEQAVLVAVLCQDMIFFELSFQPILPSLKDNYLSFNRHFLNDFTFFLIMTLCVIVTVV